MRETSARLVSALAVAACIAIFVGWTLLPADEYGLEGAGGSDPTTTLPATPQADLTIELELVAEGLTSPVTATHAGDDSDRLFVVDQVGKIRIVKEGVLLPTPFLDLSDAIVDVNPVFDERGLLGLAFHPDYEDNGRFFVRYSAPRDGEPDEPCSAGGFIVGCHDAVLAEFSVSGDPDVADPNGTVLFQVAEPQFNHNAGHVAFGPDGLLYFTLGDGGGAHDGLADVPPSHGPIGNGQDIFSPLGAILRIDVDRGSPFAIPEDNPFAGGPGADEIYAYGLRNPYRFSFDDDSSDDGSSDDDSSDGDDSRLFLADVGQNLFEEVNIIRKGGNYGWVVREGFHCFDPFNPMTPPAACPSTGPLGEPLIDPIAEYDHGLGIAAIGGFVYRGSRYADLAGKYIFGDLLGSLLFIDADGGDLSQIGEIQIGEAGAPLGLLVLGFGEDEDGELYLLTSENFGPSGETGKVFHIVGSEVIGDDEDEDRDRRTDSLQAIGRGGATGGTRELIGADDTPDESGSATPLSDRMRRWEQRGRKPSSGRD